MFVSKGMSYGTENRGLYNDLFTIVINSVLQ
jgi:hypothetical protein